MKQSKSLSVHRDVHEAIKAIARSENRSFSNLVETILREHIDGERRRSESGKQEGTDGGRE